LVYALCRPFLGLFEPFKLLLLLLVGL